MPETARTYALINILPPMAGVRAAAIGSGLLHTLLPLRLHKLGYETGAIGLVVTGYSIGFLVGCLGVPMLIRDVGHVRAHAAFAAVFALWRTRHAGKVLKEQRKGFIAYPTSSPAILEWIPFRKLRGRDRP
jgi:hypothetical protein